MLPGPKLAIFSERIIDIFVLSSADGNVFMFATFASFIIGVDLLGVFYHL